MNKNQRLNKKPKSEQKQKNDSKNEPRQKNEPKNEQLPKKQPVITIQDGEGHYAALTNLWNSKVETYEADRVAWQLEMEKTYMVKLQWVQDQLTSKVVEYSESHPQLVSEFITIYTPLITLLTDAQVKRMKELRHLVSDKVMQSQFDLSKSLSILQDKSANHKLAIESYFSAKFTQIEDEFKRTLQRLEDKNNTEIRTTEMEMVAKIALVKEQEKDETQVANVASKFETKLGILQFLFKDSKDHLTKIHKYNLNELVQDKQTILKWVEGKPINTVK